MKIIKLLRLFVVIFFIVVTTMGAGCLKKTEIKTTSFEDFGIVDSVGENNKLIQRINEASEKASSWRSDAQLFDINIFFENEKISSNYLPVAFYASAEDNYQTDYYADISNDLNSLVRFGEEPRVEEDQGMDYLEIDMEAWKIAFAEALKIAEENGGGEFRSNNENTSVILELYNDPEYGQEWAVYYVKSGESYSEPSLAIYIDSTTGEINEKVD